MRSLAKAIVAAAVVFFALGGSAAGAAPNVVLILTDDQRWDTLWAMPTVQTELVDEGITFTNSFTVNPLCCPSRASLLTGRYSHATHVYMNRGPRGLPSFDARTTIARALRAAGYRTALIGKYLNGYTTTAVPFGWDRWVVFTGSLDEGQPVGYYDYDLSVDGTLVSHGSAPQDYSTDVLAREAEAFVRNARQPFFLLFAPFAPHGPATPAPRHENAFPALAPWRPPSYDEEDVSDKPTWLRRRARIGPAVAGQIDALRTNQLRSLLAVDDAVGTIVDALEDRGLLENTLVAYTSDNGQFWGEHRLRAKMAAYDESIRVPLVVRYDALTGSEPGSEDRLVANIDIAPTLARLAGIQRRFDGRSLRPLLTGAPVEWRTSFLIENLRLNPGNVPTYCAVRASRWTYVVIRTGEEELYDLRSDPYQLTNLAGDPARHAQLLTMRARVRELCDPPPPNMNLDDVCTQEGSSAANTLVGTPRSDGLCGKGGNDYLSGREGKDLLRGGPGRDRILGGPDGDRIRARDGVRDEIVCGLGDDRVFADKRDDVAPDCERVTR